MKTVHLAHMDKKQLLDFLAREADKLWDSYIEIFPKLARFDAPKITLNSRFTRCAGCNNSAENIVELGFKFFAKYSDNMIQVILPHEIAHQIDYNLNGWYNRKPHHGKQWVDIMVKIGQPANPYHCMEL